MSMAAAQEQGGMKHKHREATVWVTRRRPWSSASDDLAANNRRGGRRRGVLLPPPPPPLLLLLCVVCLTATTSRAQNVSFSVSPSQFVSADLMLLGDAFINGDGNLELTTDSAIRALYSSVGRALHRQPVRLYHPPAAGTGAAVASFRTAFEFRISNTSAGHGDGLAFLLAPDAATVGSYGGWLGVLNSSTDGDPRSRTLAVELDTYRNAGPPMWDPDDNHVGVDVNRMRSVVTATPRRSGDGRVISLLGDPGGSGSVKVWVDYDGAAKVLSVSVDDGVPPVKPSAPVLQYEVDVSEYLSQYAYVGFAAATGGWIEVHTVLSWTFDSWGLPPAADDAPPGGNNGGAAPASAPELGNGGNGSGGGGGGSPWTTSAPPPPPSTAPSAGRTAAPPPPSNRRWRSPAAAPAPAPGQDDGLAAAATTATSCKVFVCRKRFVVAFSSAFGVVLTTALGVCFLAVVRRRTAAAAAAAMRAGHASDSEYVVGPRKFTYKELCTATKDFSPRKLLGSGGSGSVYKGVLPDCGTQVAVKRISAASRSGRREFTAELSIISRLRHRNLVPLKGWCSSKGQLLLVYEYMPNGSLDRLLFPDLMPQQQQVVQQQGGKRRRGGDEVHVPPPVVGLIGDARSSSTTDSDSGRAADVRQGLLWNWRRRERKAAAAGGTHVSLLNKDQQQQPQQQQQQQQRGSPQKEEEEEEEACKLKKRVAGHRLPEPPGPVAPAQGLEQQVVQVRVDDGREDKERVVVGATSSAVGSSSKAPRQQEAEQQQPQLQQQQAEQQQQAAPQFVLAWERRYKIVRGVAAALCYLHDEWEMRVIHRDVKASNVLLDSNYNARLGDFGLARATDHSRQPDTTVIVGTFGYLAPESTHTGRATDKSDVFSFGAVALEVACGRRPIERDYPAPEVVLVDWVWALHKLGRLLDAADSRLRGAYDSHQMARLLRVGLACSHPDPAHRPSMRAVVHILDGDAPVPALPTCKPTPTYSAAVLSPPVTIQDIIAQLDFMGSSSSGASSGSEADELRFSPANAAVPAAAAAAIGTNTTTTTTSAAAA